MLPYNIRNTLSRLGEAIYQIPEQFKAWSQNESSQLFGGNFGGISIKENRTNPLKIIGYESYSIPPAPPKSPSRDFFLPPSYVSCPEATWVSGLVSLFHGKTHCLKPTRFLIKYKVLTGSYCHLWSI